ncbi:unnamed protein product [Ranitomeya imitator]|uniref:Phosphoinositide phospholipase C n=1 Tax=Ranitomeya imitator TaxID=111125 RepID=A0ABN9MU42_9NEOB|nr:unnamed protein product [Ranitomeya imitator]
MNGTSASSVHGLPLVAVSGAAASEVPSTACYHDFALLAGMQSGTSAPFRLKDPTVVDSRTCWGRDFQRMGDIREKSWRRLDEERISVEERRRSWEDRRSRLTAAVFWLLKPTLGPDMCTKQEQTHSDVGNSDPVPGSPQQSSTVVRTAFCQLCEKWSSPCFGVLEVLLETSPKLREVFNLDFPENNFLAKTLCIITGSDMVDLTFHNFVSYKENVGKDWATDIMTYIKNPLLNNASRYSFYEKIIQGQLVQHLQKLKKGANYVLRKNTRKTHTSIKCGRKNSCTQNDAINPEDFPESVYRTFLMQLCPRPEIDEIFTSHHSKAKPYMTKDHLTKFINQKQRDSRLNELLFPPAKIEQVQVLIEKYEPSAINKQRGQLSPEGMVWFLCGSENSIVSMDKLLVNQDMNQPLTHYFINSSHNTYLTAGQFSGVSSPEMYRQTLLSGCRCVELDCWKGKPPEEEPIITHGFTMTTEILFKDVIEAIAESAFKTSPYPVVLSFENHVDSLRMACFTSMESSFDHMFTSQQNLPNASTTPQINSRPFICLIENYIMKDKMAVELQIYILLPVRRFLSDKAAWLDDLIIQCVALPKIKLPSTKMLLGYGQRDNQAEEDAEKEGESEEVVETVDEEQMKQMQSDEGTAGQEAMSYEEMSSLVNYVQPVKFESFEISAQKNQSYVISSFVETKAYDLMTKFPVQFVEYNKRQMSRIYPKGTRMDSSNYMPQMFWNAGCQMVALNFQTMDLAMQQNMALFEFNGSSGYILKHEFMRRTDKQFDPFTVDRIDVVVANTLAITIISGQFLSDKSVKTYVEVELFGLPGDPKRKYKTKLTSTANSINPVWKEEPFTFEKVP